MEFSGALSARPLWASYVLHDTVYIVMYPAAEVLALLHMDCV